MTTKPFFSGRIPQELFNCVEEHSKKTGISKTDILVKALSLFLDRPIESDSLSNKELTERILKIEQQLKSIDVIKTDNIDNDKPQQLSLLNSSDDNKNIAEEEVVIEEQNEYRESLGTMRIPEILTLPFQTELDTKKIDRKIRNHFVKKKDEGEPKNKELRIDHYLIKWAGQESGKRGAIKFEVFKT
jgi:hypothetical protein